MVNKKEGGESLTHRSPPLINRRSKCALRRIALAVALVFGFTF